MEQKEVNELNKKANYRFIVYVGLGCVVALLFWLWV